MYQIELNRCKKGRENLFIALLFLTVIDIILIAMLMLYQGVIISEFLKDIIMSIVTGIVPSIFVTIFIYYKYLKKIPDETEKKVNELLNDRLNYETAQHEGTMRALNPDNAQLSIDHRQILNDQRKINENLLNIAGKMNSYEQDKETQYRLLNGESISVVNIIEKLNLFSELYQKTNKKVYDLEKQNSLLKERLDLSKEKINQLEKKNSELKKEIEELSRCSNTRTR